MEILARSRLTSKEQLSLPAAIRRLLGIHAGDELVWMKDPDGRLVVEPARSHSLADIRAAVAAAASPKAPHPAPPSPVKALKPPSTETPRPAQNRPPSPAVDYGCD